MQAEEAAAEPPSPANAPAAEVFRVSIVGAGLLRNDPSMLGLRVVGGSEF